MSRLPGRVLAASAVLLAAGAAAPPAGAFDDPRALLRMLHAASVVVASGCSGALVEDRDLVVTARHCVRNATVVEVALSTGETRRGRVVAEDRGADQALLLLDAPVAVEPLQLARRPPSPRDRLYFEGNPSRPNPQEVRLDRVGTCPSLPRLPNALFTSIEGEPGDSGAPLVDRAARVVGLVHGGERCHIATPADTLWGLLLRVFEWGPDERALVRTRAGDDAAHGGRVVPLLARQGAGALLTAPRGRTPARSA